MFINVYESYRIIRVFNMNERKTFKEQMYCRLILNNNFRDADDDDWQRNDMIS